MPIFSPGDPAPWFVQRSFANPNYVFSAAAGRYVVLCFFGSAATGMAQRILNTIKSWTQTFDDHRACFFGISIDPEDERQKRVADSYPGFRFIWDFDLKVSKLYRAVQVSDGQHASNEVVLRQWLVLDPTLRVMKALPMLEDGREIPELENFLLGLPPPSEFLGFEVPAPILILPNAFERELCDTLIEHYEIHGGQDSGFMREVNGKTVLVVDSTYKRRRDVTISDPRLIKEIQARVRRRINPEIQKVHSFLPTRMERYIVACYSAEDGGHFRSHRDNTTKGTEHRRFAVSINLNDSFCGGEISFPEYGSRRYKAPVGGAVVFSCSLLHAVSPVTEGRRYAFLPFLYDEAAAKVREANNAYLADGISPYRPSSPSTEG